MRFSVGWSDLLCDCFLTLVSAVFAAMGLLREGFLVGGEPEDEACDLRDRDGDVDFFLTGMGLTSATGLTAVGDDEV